MGWATEVDLLEYLQAAGLVSMTPTAREQLLDLETALDAAIERWNDETHYWPFLSTGDATEHRRFPSPWPSNILDLNGGLLAITSLGIGATSTASYTTLYTYSANYRPLPRDAAQRKRPWTLIEFLSSPGNPHDGEIDIEGEWGFCNEANLPKSAIMGVLAFAALSLLPQIVAGIAQGLLRWTEGDVTKQFGSPAEARRGWEAIAHEAISGIHAKRTRIG